MIDNIFKYLNNKEEIEYLFSSLIDIMEIWENFLQIAFAESITKIFKNTEKSIIYLSLIDIFNPLIKYLIKIISSNDEAVNLILIKTKTFYILSLNEITNFISSNTKIQVDSETIDFVVNLGNFGKSNISKRFSVYFCSCLFQVILLIF